MSTAPEPPVRTWRKGRVGRIQLNRPAALNALTHEMVGHIRTALDDWVADPAVATVAITGAGHRAFCAGGDIVSIYQDASSSVPAGDTCSAAFWRDEYSLNLAISRYPKPYFAVMSGIVLGGGVGLSAHGSHRIVTETSSIGMPETGIGFIPDVGGTWLLSRAPGELGVHLGLTAGSVGGSDAIRLGLADYFVPETSVDELLDSLATVDAAEAIRMFSVEPPPAKLDKARAWVDECYAHDSIDDILAALSYHDSPAAHEAAVRIQANSPTAITVTLRALRAAREMRNLEQALRQELRLAVHFLDNPDFAEGIRAAVIDKDRQPRWQPPEARLVDAVRVDAYFEPLSIEGTHQQLLGGIE